ncbi:MAG: hypothetical protein JEY91_09820 [Spirochaetaceae bacterium]|nr:hypothetical protein [Spirochaetaceae bacterium]
MKSQIKKTIPFLLMFLLATGSVIVSCATRVGNNGQDSVIQERFSINTYMNGRGKIFTNNVFSQIDKILIISNKDRSEKAELQEGDWSYNRDTTEIIFNNRKPDSNSLIYVEGFIDIPNKIILNNCNPNKLPFIAINGNPGVLNLDYYWDLKSKTITFMNNISCSIDKYYIIFDDEDSVFGSYSIGNWDWGFDKNGDKLSYLIAEYWSKQQILLYESEEQHYFLDKNYIQGTTPSLVKRKPTKEERDALYNQPHTVKKYRRSLTNSQLSREVGYDISVPEQIAGIALLQQSDNKVIYEQKWDGAIVNSVPAIYHPMNKSFQSIVLWIFKPENPGQIFIHDRNFIIEETELNLGKKITKTIGWEISYSGDPLDLIPFAEKKIHYSWKDDSASFEIKVPEKYEQLTEHLITEVISFRNNLYN